MPSQAGLLGQARKDCDDRGRSNVREGEGRPQESWEQQWEQVQLGLERVTAIYAGRGETSADAVYDIRAFFLTCHHLGEWIREDETVPQAARDRVGEVVESSVELKICTDIANGSKHRTLTTSKTGDLCTAFQATTPPGSMSAQQE